MTEVKVSNTARQATPEDVVVTFVQDELLKVVKGRTGLDALEGFLRWQAGNLTLTLGKGKGPDSPCRVVGHRPCLSFAVARASLLRLDTMVLDGWMITVKKTFDLASDMCRSLGDQYTDVPLTDQLYIMTHCCAYYGLEITDMNKFYNRCQRGCELVGREVVIDFHFTVEHCSVVNLRHAQALVAQCEGLLSASRQTIETKTRRLTHLQRELDYLNASHLNLEAEAIEAQNVLRSLCSVPSTTSPIP